MAATVSAIETAPILSGIANIETPLSTSTVDQQHGFRMIRGPVNAPWGVAQAFCEEHGMALPKPRNDRFNSMYVEAGGRTWLDENVNSLIDDGKYENWLDRRRGYLNQNGRWSIRSGGDHLPYFCVERGKYQIYIH